MGSRPLQGSLQAGPAEARPPRVICSSKLDAFHCQRLIFQIRSTQNKQNKPTFNNLETNRRAGWCLEISDLLICSLLFLSQKTLALLCLIRASQASQACFWACRFGWVQAEKNRGAANSKPLMEMPPLTRGRLKTKLLQGRALHLGQLVFVHGLAEIQLIDPICKSYVFK